MSHPRFSRIQIRNKLGFQLGYPVLQFELALFHAPQAKLIYAGVFRQPQDGRIQVTMFFPELGNQACDFTRIDTVIGHRTSVVQI